MEQLGETKGLLSNYTRQQALRKDKPKSFKPKTPRTSDGYQGRTNFYFAIFAFSILFANIASGVTTYNGIRSIIAQDWLSFLITFAIQGLMFGTAMILAFKANLDKKGSILLLYLTPMLVSVFFNYVYFWDKFSEQSSIQNAELNSKIELENTAVNFRESIPDFLSNIQTGLQSELIDAEEKLRVAQYAMSDELTERGTGGKGPGPYYRQYRNESNQLSAKFDTYKEESAKLNKLSNDISKTVMFDSVDSLKMANSRLLRVYAQFGHYATNDIPVPSFKVYPAQLLQRGERHSVHEAFSALFSPDKFTILALSLGILIDFVIFIWVFLRLIGKVDIQSLTREVENVA
ncbi:MAG: hypothetical protein DWQ05_06245 [Calditrichaeota bacterium]|nr:MAG: hypothetical protein DWQ05_06245 [Calditrichota bacterium]